MWELEPEIQTLLRLSRGEYVRLLALLRVLPGSLGVGARPELRAPVTNSFAAILMNHRLRRQFVSETLPLHESFRKLTAEQY